MTIRVLLADDNEPVRKAISRLLDGNHDIQLVGEATSFSQTIHASAKLRPHVIIMDLHMKDGEGLTASQVKSSLNGSQLLAISLWQDDETKALADHFGAATLLDKINLATELIPAIKRYAHSHEPDQLGRGEFQGTI